MRIRLRTILLTLRQRLAIAWSLGHRKPASREQAVDFIEGAVEDKLDEVVEKHGEGK